MSADGYIRYRFDPLDRHTMGGIAFRYVSSDRNGIVFSRVDDPKLQHGLTHAGFEACRRLPDYRLDPGWFNPARIKTRLRTGTAFIADAGNPDQRVVVFRAAVCTLFLRMEEAGEASRSDRSMKAALKRIAPEVAHLHNPHTLKKDGTPKRSRKGATDLRGMPGPKCLRQWLARLKASDFDPQALKPHYDNCGSRMPVIGPDLRTLSLKFITRFATNTKPSKAQLYQDFLDALAALNARRTAAGQPALIAPSSKWFNAEIRDLDAFDVYAGRWGPAKARAKFKLISLGVDAVWPLQRIEVDEWEVSLMTLMIDSGQWEALDDVQKAAVERAKCWICVAICVATRCIVGLTLSNKPSARSVLATLRMVVSDKGAFVDAYGALSAWDMAGGLGEVTTDGGPSFTATEVGVAILDLGGQPHITPSGIPFLRARIERVFRTVHTHLIARFSGRTFEDIARLGDYPSERKASLCVDQLRWALVRYVVDVYHNLPHAGLGGETPRNAWIRLAREYDVKQPPDRFSIRAAFGRRFKCMLGRGGVRVLGLYYQSLTLHDYFKKVDAVEVEVRVDELDLGAVSVCVGGPFLTVPCVLPDFADVSIRDWTQTLAELQRRHSDDAKPTLPVVMQTRREIEAMRKTAEAAASITPESFSDKELAQLERSLAFGFIPMEPEAPVTATGDAGFDDVIAVTGPSSSSDEAAAIEPVPASTPDDEGTVPDAGEAHENSPPTYRILD